MRELRNRGSLGDLLWKIEDGISVVMLAHLDEVIRSGVGKQIDPFLRIERIGGKVLEEVIVNDVRTIVLQVELIRAISGIGPIVQVPPIPMPVSSAQEC